MSAEQQPMEPAPKLPRLDWQPIIEHAAAIVLSYDTGVTLRQLFYRLVAPGLLPNTDQAYKRLSKLTAKARRDGTFPDLIDRGRAVRRPLGFDGPVEALAHIAETYRRDRTEGQEVALYVGVEKATMIEQLRSWFNDRGIPIAPLGGFSSQTFVDVVSREVGGGGRPAVLIYAGDFDSSGEDIDRDFIHRSACFVEVRRVALNRDQVIDLDLPLQPGKVKDSRSAAFKARHGVLVQVELEALEPDDLRAMYEAAIEPWWDEGAYRDSLRREEPERERLVAVARAEARRRS